MSRLRICYAAPGHTLLSTSGSARNVLSVAAALAAWAEVTVAFRDLAEPVAEASYRVVAIDAHAATVAHDDVGVRGLNPFPHAAHLRMVRDFARRSAGAYDLVLEKGWRFSGYLSRQLARAGVPSVLIENDVRYWAEPVRSPRALAKWLAHGAAQLVAGHCSRRLPLIIAETAELKDALVAVRGIAPERIEVVALGVDHARFRPQDQARARESLGIDPNATVLLYVGGLDLYHDLGPLIEALGRAAPPALELHVVGDGERRAAYQAAAARLDVRARFHGQRPHHEVPSHIAAADLCLAPYQPRHFLGGRIAFSTLKIPEYMACERPVASVPHGHITDLIDPATGFLLPNEPQAWTTFLQTLPSRPHLAAMGHHAAAKVAHLSWEATAGRYLELGRRLLPGR